MSALTLWHNPRCSKSRGARALLDEATDDVEIEVREYLKEPPTRAELEHLMELLGLDDPRDMMRTGEGPYEQLGLGDASSDELLDAIEANPILLERPIVVRGDRAVIARPPELARRLLD